MTEEAEELPPIDIAELDEMCAVMLNPSSSPADIETACKYVDDFKKRDDAWEHFSEVIEGDTQIQTKYTLIDVIIELLDKKWKFLSPENVQSLTERIVTYTHELSEMEDIPAPIISRIDLAYVTLILHEWPVLQSELFTTLFVTDEISGNQVINNLRILATLFEEVFNEENEKLTSVIRNAFITNISNRSQEVLEFLLGIIGEDNEEIVMQCFKCFNCMAKYVSPDVLKETNFFDIICQNFLTNPEYSTCVLQTISTIFDDEYPNAALVEFVPGVFNAVCESVATTGTDFSEVDPSIICAIAEALTVFINKYPEIVEVEEFGQQIAFVCNWIMQAMDIDDIDTFRTCNEYWNNTLKRFTSKQKPMIEDFKLLYQEFFPAIAQILIRRMPRPPEVIIKSDGESLQREDQTETTEADLFKTAKNNIWNIAKLDTDNTLRVFLEVNAQLQRSFDADVFNSFYWSVGAISGSLQKAQEVLFISQILMPMIPMCDTAANEIDRGFIASGIMYICAQYPRFISSTVEFFQVVIDKLIQFMNQDVPGIPEMAVNTFKTIGQRAKQTFCMVKGETRPMIFDVIDRIDEMTCNLPPALKAGIYDALSKIANGFMDKHINMRESVLHAITNPLNETLNSLSDSVGGGALPETLFVLDCHRLIAPNIPTLYNGVLHSIFGNLMQIYTNYSQAVVAMITQGANPTDIINARKVKSAVLQIFLSFLNSIPANEQTMGQRQEAMGDLAGPILDVIVPDYVQTQDEALFWQDGDYEEDFGEEEEHPVYQKKPPFVLADAKVPEVLELFTQFARYMPDAVDHEALVQIFTQIFSVTVPILGKSKNYASYPQFRLPFYEMIHAMVSNYMEGFLDPEFLNSLLKAIKKGEEHPGSDICSVSLLSMAQFAINIPKVEDAKNYLEELLRHSFEILVDATHKSVFDQQVDAIHTLLCQLNEFGTYTKEAYAYLINGSLQQIELPTLVAAVEQLLTVIEDFAQFRQTVRDILVENKTYSPMDPEIREMGAEELKQMAEQSMEAQGAPEEPPPPE